MWHGCRPLQTEKLAVVTQTTLSVDDTVDILAAVKARFPMVREPKQQDICYATQNRQDAVKLLSPQVDVVIVVGSPTSSNSNRLREVAFKLGTPAHMVDSAEELQAEWFEDRARVGLTAGASAPEILVQQVIDRLKALGAISVRKMDGLVETVKFPLPKGLKIEGDDGAPSCICTESGALHRTYNRHTMLDINTLRKDLDATIARLETRKKPQAFLNVDAFKDLESERKKIQTRTEELQSQRNTLSKQIGSSKPRGRAWSR